MINFRYKDLFFDLYTTKEDFNDGQINIIAFDYLYLKCYSPLYYLKKCTYNNYINLYFDLFRVRLVISFGLIKTVDYNFGFKKFKERQRLMNEKIQY